MKNIIITFIGADNSGKTTIAKKLSNIIKIRYFKCTPRIKKIIDSNINGLYYQTPLILDLVLSLKQNIIIDRGYPCEYAYSKVYNRTTDIDFILEMDKQYSSKALNILIYCYKTYYKKFDDDLVKLEHIKSINNFYNEFLYYSTAHIIKLDTTNEDIDTQIKFIIDKVKELTNVFIC